MVEEAQARYQDIMSKLRSKQDIYNFLILDNDLYLPDIDCISTYFMK
jgi:hypothetical protein